MSKSYSGENTLTYLIMLVQNAIKGLIPKSDIVNNLNSTDSDKPLSAAQGKVLAEQIANAGYGDMLKSVYDTDEDGTVDNAAALDGHPASYFSTPASVAEYVAGLKGQANGLAPLSADGKINSTFLPSYVDDVIEGYYFDGAFYEDEAHKKLIPGERGKIYVDLDTNISYRYGGTTYVSITSSDLVEIDNATVQAIWDAAGGRGNAWTNSN